MNRNVESHFAELPGVEIRRSMFDRSSTHKTSFDTGLLIPFYVDEFLPGDTFRVTTSVVIRLQTLLNPIYDNVYLDTYWFALPDYILWDHTHQFFGESNKAWYPDTEYTVPTIKYPDNGWQVGTIADYLGIPVGVHPVELPGNPVYPNALPFRGYASICQNWFLDQNVSDPLQIPTGDAQVTGSNGSNYITDVAKGGQPFKVAKYHDYFTSCLPGTQKGPAVSIFGEQMSVDSSERASFRSDVPVHTGDTRSPAGAGEHPLIGYVSGGSNRFLGMVSGTGANQNAQLGLVSGSSIPGFEPTNLWADLSYANLTINELRLAFQLQKFFEKNARGGSRYKEILLSHFGVHSPDARMMIPEYLGGHRIPLTIHQVTNQAQGENDFLGDLGAFSATSDVHEDFVKSFSCHGYIMGVCCVRYDHTYPQGLERMWTRRHDTDFYWPVFANIGEQPVYTKELYLETSGTNGDVFGFQEAWADYRFKPSRCSGEMRPGVANSLANWHLADYYQSAPILSDSWIREDKNNVDRVLAVTSQNAHQVFADFYVKNICTRPMPMYSVPGLIDHH